MNLLQYAIEKVTIGYHRRNHFPFRTLRPFHLSRHLFQCFSTQEYPPSITNMYRYRQKCRDSNMQQFYNRIPIHDVLVCTSRSACDKSMDAYYIWMHCRKGSIQEGSIEEGGIEEKRTITISNCRMPPLRYSGTAPFDALPSKTLPATTSNFSEFIVGLYVIHARIRKESFCFKYSWIASNLLYKIKLLH